MEQITKENLEIVSKYLGQRLGIYGINWYDINWEDTEKLTSQIRGTAKIKKHHLGIFSLALEECEFQVKIWTSQLKEKGIIFIDTGLAYHHISGGSNGCDLSIKMKMRVQDNELWEIEK
jgi:hypothetical protein